MMLGGEDRRLSLASLLPPATPQRAWGQAVLAAFGLARRKEGRA